MCNDRWCWTISAVINVVNRFRSSSKIIWLSELTHFCVSKSICDIKCRSEIATAKHVCSRTRKITDVAFSQTWDSRVKVRQWWWSRKLKIIWNFISPVDVRCNASKHDVLCLFQVFCLLRVRFWHLAHPLQCNTVHACNHHPHNHHFSKMCCLLPTIISTS